MKFVSLVICLIGLLNLVYSFTIDISNDIKDTNITLPENILDIIDNFGEDLNDCYYTIKNEDIIIDISNLNVPKPIKKIISVIDNDVMKLEDNELTLNYYVLYTIGNQNVKGQTVTSLNKRMQDKEFCNIKGAVGGAAGCFIGFIGLGLAGCLGTLAGAGLSYFM